MRTIHLQTVLSGGKLSSIGGARNWRSKTNVRASMLICNAPVGTNAVCILVLHESWANKCFVWVSCTGAGLFRGTYAQLHANGTQMIVYHVLQLLDWRPSLHKGMSRAMLATGNWRICEGWWDATSEFRTVPQLLPASSASDSLHVQISPGINQCSWWPTTRALRPSSSVDPLHRTAESGRNAAPQCCSPQCWRGP